MEITIEVRGIPKPGGSKRGFVINGRAVLTDASGKAGKDWRGDCKAAALLAMANRDAFKVPLEVSFTFSMPRPNKHFRTNGDLKADAPTHCPIRPDTTKLIRSIEDALTGIVWKDDALIVKQTAEKVYSDTPGAVVRVRAIE